MSSLWDRVSSGARNLGSGIVNVGGTMATGAANLVGATNIAQNIAVTTVVVSGAIEGNEQSQAILSTAVQETQAAVAAIPQNVQESYRAWDDGMIAQRTEREARQREENRQEMLDGTGYVARAARYLDSMGVVAVEAAGGIEVARYLIPHENLRTEALTTTRGRLIGEQAQDTARFINEAHPSEQERMVTRANVVIDQQIRMCRAGGATANIEALEQLRERLNDPSFNVRAEFTVVRGPDGTATGLLGPDGTAVPLPSGLEVGNDSTVTAGRILQNQLHQMNSQTATIGLRQNAETLASAGRTVEVALIAAAAVVAAPVATAAGVGAAGVVATGIGLGVATEATLGAATEAGVINRQVGADGSADRSGGSGFERFGANVVAWLQGNDQRRGELSISANDEANMIVSSVPLAGLASKIPGARALLHAAVNTFVPPPEDRNPNPSTPVDNPAVTSLASIAGAANGPQSLAQDHAVPAPLSGIQQMINNFTQGLQTAAQQATPEPPTSPPVDNALRNPPSSAQNLAELAMATAREAARNALPASMLATLGISGGQSVDSTQLPSPTQTVALVKQAPSQGIG